MVSTATRPGRSSTNWPSRTLLDASKAELLRSSAVEHRPLGRSGLRVSEITYGNWLTHGELVAREAALACVLAALEAGITTFDTADVYARGAAEELLGEALRGVRRESVEIATKV